MALSASGDIQDVAAHEWVANGKTPPHSVTVTYSAEDLEKGTTGLFVDLANPYPTAGLPPTASEEDYESHVKALGADIRGTCCAFVQAKKRECGADCVKMDRLDYCE